MNLININSLVIARHKLSLSDADAKEFVLAIYEVLEVEKNDIATKDFVKKELAETKNDILNCFVGIFITLAIMIFGLYLKN